MNDFDIVIVGSGPAAVAAIHALDKSQRIAVVAGNAIASNRTSKVHPKIQAVASARDELAGVTEPLLRRHGRREPLFSTAAIGGLANYWGQQFVRFSSGDPWPRQLFGDFEGYSSACQTIEGLFCLEGQEELSTPLPVPSNFRASVPRLLTGAPDDPNAGLAAMRNAYWVLEKLVDATTFETRVASFEQVGNRWCVLLDDGSKIYASRVLLAAGVIGTARLLLRTYPDLSRARFRDCSPWMLYVLNLGPLLEQRPLSARHHFNAITIERVDNERCTLFASIYDMKRADLNLILTSTIGRAPSLFRGWQAPPGAAIIKPVQVWTPTAEDVIEIDALTSTASMLPRASNRPGADLDLNSAIEILASLGARVLKISQTVAGFGFHYHGLDLKPKDKPFVSVTELLRERTGDGIFCVDASILRSVGCRPHTLTAMASARHIVEHMTPTD
jgi:glycine/D-amino acid oxidase-like deaminating enzyme